MYLILLLGFFTNVFSFKYRPVTGSRPRLRLTTSERVTERVNGARVMALGSKDDDQEEVFGTQSKRSELLKYYAGLVTDPISDLQVNEEHAKRDNLTPNLRFAAIWVVILASLSWAFFEANKDVPAFPV